MRKKLQRQGETRQKRPAACRGTALVAAAVLAAGMLGGCGAQGTGSGNAGTASSGDTDALTAESAPEESSASAETDEVEASATLESSFASTEDAGESGAAGTEKTEDAGEGTSSAWSVPDAEAIDYDGTEIRVGALKGPTTMGLVNLMKASDDGNSIGKYTFDMESDPSAIVASVASGDLDIAMVPANLASSLYNKTKGGVRVIDINTLGVLYCVTGDDSIQSVKDFAGKTVLTTGQGATPEYVLNYLLSENDVTDCTLEFHSESTEIAALLKENPDQIAVLPQPFVTAAEAQNDQLKTAFSLTDEWDKVTTNGSKLLTGATVVRTDFLAEHEDAVKVFEAEHMESVARAVDYVDGTAQLVADYGIVEKAPVAKKALPECNIVCITGEDMKTAMSGYLQVLYDADPKSVGGTLPGDDFYDLTAAVATEDSAE